jgi:hypothetical protein
MRGFSLVARRLRRRQRMRTALSLIEADVGSTHREEHESLPQAGE